MSAADPRLTPAAAASERAEGRQGGGTAAASTPPFLAACRRQPSAYTPIWVMRQAGRYLPEYRALRAKTDFVTLTRTPDLAAEVTMQPLRRFELDAAILFSDIMTPLQGMGVQLEFAPGPVVASPIRSDAQIDALPELVPTRDVPYVLETIKLVRANVPRGAPLIGFAGGPFTLFCYLVGGRPSKEFEKARSFLFAQPQSAERLLDKLADAMAAYLRAQAEAGAQALMLFESWAGLLGPREFDRFALRAARRVFAGLKNVGVPLIYYPNNGGAVLDQVAPLEVDVIGIDWRTPLNVARNILGPNKAVQGNLDPAALFASPEDLKRNVAAVLKEAGPNPGHVFNLGHGIWQETNPDNVARLVDYVHELSAR